MNKTIRLTLTLAVVMLATSACKTKQKIAEIPAGANVEATAPKTVATRPTPVVAEPSENRAVSNETEVTRNENFSLADGETNTDALKYKYHVVVVNEKGMFRVLMTSVNDYRKAHTFINQISSRFPDAWVLVQK